MRIISGELGGRLLKTVSGPGYRPATDKVRQALFSMLEARGVEWSHCRVLDLFAGSGSLGFEALSRGAASACFVEKMRQAAAVIGQNAESLGLDSTRVSIIAKDVRTVLKKRTDRPFDLAFIDPPYRKGLLKPVMRMLLQSGWLQDDGLVAAEVEVEIRPDDVATSELVELVDKTYGQTRICIWQQRSRPRQSTRGPSTP
jgi:16S rRNA (guanine966-N2)-methyltransferase